MTSRTVCGIARRGVSWHEAAPFGYEQAHDLTEKERVTLRLFGNGRDELRARRLARRQLEVATDVRLDQAGENDAPRDGLAP